MSVQSQDSTYTKENIEILASTVVEGWDQKAIIQFAIDHLIRVYDGDEECFKRDWDSYIKYYI